MSTKRRVQVSWLVAALAALPFFAPSYYVSLFTTAMIGAMLAPDVFAFMPKSYHIGPD